MRNISVEKVSGTLAMDHYFLDLSNFHCQFCVASKGKTV